MDLLVSKLPPLRRWTVGRYYRRLFERYEADILRAKALFADDRSVRVLDALLAAYSTKRNNSARLFAQAADLSEDGPGSRDLPNRSNLPGGSFEIQEAENLYFLPELFSFSEPVVLLDGGAFIGDSLQLAYQMLGKKLLCAYAFEPNPKSFDALRKTAEALPFPVHLSPCAIGSAAEETRFSESGSSTRRDSRGDMVARTIEIGGFLEHLEQTPDAPLPNFIKLDIEGCEPEAIASMSSYLRRNRPDLAISVYHHVEDLWQIPLLLRAICPDYRLYLRHHSNYFTETVLYAKIEPAPASRKGNIS